MHSNNIRGAPFRAENKGNQEDHNYNVDLNADWSQIIDLFHNLGIEDVPKNEIYKLFSNPKLVGDVEVSEEGSISVVINGIDTEIRIKRIAERFGNSDYPMIVYKVL
jgi:hypothetical protein